MAYDCAVPSNLGSSWVVGLAASGALLLHLLQVLLFGHDLIGVFDGHGLEVLPGLLLAPSPVLLVGALSLAFGVAVLVVLLARAACGAPRWLPAQTSALVGVASRVRSAPQALGVRRHGRAPPSLLT